MAGVSGSPFSKPSFKAYVPSKFHTTHPRIDKLCDRYRTKRTIGIEDSIANNFLKYPSVAGGRTLVYNSLGCTESKDFEIDWNCSNFSVPQSLSENAKT